MSNKFNIDSDAIKKLAEILNDTNLTEIEYEDSGRRVRVVRDLTPVSMPVMQTPALAASAAPAVAVAPAAESLSASHPGALKSPMVGMAYLSAEPGAAPFVKVGDTVTAGQTVLIIEAMKVMNPIKAPKSGKVKHVFIQDAQPIEFGEPLLIIE